jgi:hypothetical protein
MYIKMFLILEYQNNDLLTMRCSEIYCLIHLFLNCVFNNFEEVQNEKTQTYGADNNGLGLSMLPQKKLVFIISFTI